MLACLRQGGEETPGQDSRALVLVNVELLGLNETALGEDLLHNVDVLVGAKDGVEVLL